MAAIFNRAIFNDAIFNTAVGVAPAAETVRGWHFETWGKKKKRLTEEELREMIRLQRIELGILPPDPMAPQAIPEPQDIAIEVADAVNDQVVMADLSIEYRRIYKLAFMEAELAIAEYRRAKDIKRRKTRRAIGLLMMH